MSDEIRIPEHIEVGADPGLPFELAGPRAKLYFDGTNTRASETENIYKLYSEVSAMSGISMPS